MSKQEIINKLTSIFRDVFDDETIVVNELTTSEDIKNWDSLTHISLIGEVEEEFDFKFEMKDVIGMKNVGEMIAIIEREV